MNGKWILCVIFVTVSNAEDLDPSAKPRQQIVEECSAMDLQKPQFAQEPMVFQNVADRDIIVYSAYFEERPNAYGPSIRIIAVGLQERFHKVEDLYCTFWYENGDKALAIGPAIYKVIYPSTAHATMWTSHFILCKLPSGKHRVDGVPYAVSVTPTPCAKPENKLMVLNRVPTPPAKKNGHALCLPAVYNKFNNWPALVELFETHRLLGANAIVVYTFSITKETRIALEHYVAKSDKKFRVHLVTWMFPSSILVNYMVQRGAINDCYYRMRNKFKYITISDLDEVLVPRMVRFWPDLLSNIAKDQYGAYLFQHAYFRRNYTLQEEKKQDLISQSSFWRTDVVVPAGKIRSKAMYDADRAISLAVHCSYELVPGAEEYIVDPSEGMLHHYRPSPMENFRKHPEKYTFIEDRYIEWMEKALTEAYKKKVAQIENDIAAEKGKKHTEL